LIHFEQFGDAAHGQGLLGVGGILRNGTSWQGKWGYFWNQGDKTSRKGHVSRHFVQFGDVAHGLYNWMNQMSLQVKTFTLALTIDLQSGIIVE